MFTPTDGTPPKLRSVSILASASATRLAHSATPEQIATARAVFPDSKDLVIVAIGDAAKIRDTMQAYGPLTEMKLTDPRFSP